MKFKVVLNGTDTNPFARYGLTQNPFPQVARREYEAPLRIVQSLGGEPLKGVEDIRERLRGFSEEFVDGCCERFRAGEMVEFMVEFPG